MLSQDAVSAYRDAVMDITFRKVRSYTMSIPPEYDWPEKVQRVGHGDWLDYELRLTERALPVLEVEFSAGGYWMIESEDIIYRLEPLQPRVRKVNR